MISSSIQANPNCAETFASLRLYGDSLDPDEVTRLLRLDPSDSASRGSKFISPSGKTRTAPMGRWILETRRYVDSTDLQQHLEWLLDQLETTGIIPAQVPGVTRADVFCYWVSATGHGGPQFPAELLARLARARLGLGLDIYSFPAAQ